MRCLTLRFLSKAEVGFLGGWLSNDNPYYLVKSAKPFTHIHFALNILNIWLYLRNTHTLYTRWDGHTDWRRDDWLSCNVLRASRKVFTRRSLPQEFTFAVLSLGVSLVTDAHWESGRNAMGAAYQHSDAEMAFDSQASLLQQLYKKSKSGNSAGYQESRPLICVLSPLKTESCFWNNKQM